MVFTNTNKITSKRKSGRRRKRKRQGREKERKGKGWKGERAREKRLGNETETDRSICRQTDTGMLPVIF